MAKTDLINVGSLKLLPKDVPKYKKALEFYGYESTSVYLRQVALALIKHAERQDSLVSPLALRTTNPNGSPD